MSSENKEDRRQFLKNTTLAALAVTVISSDALSNEEGEALKPEQAECDPTTLDFYGEGPFYTDNPPEMVENVLADLSAEGERMIISGRVFNLDCSEFIPNVRVDVWHADNDGAYDNNGFNLRGVCYSNAQGFYSFETIKPGKYLNGANFRPSHIHFKITAPGFGELITQLYFDGDTSIPGDAAASITSGNFDATNRIIELTSNEQEVLEGTWDIVINGDGTALGVADVHIDKGVIYSISPNPFVDVINIRYGVFKRSKVSLLVFDDKGRTVATLEERELSPEQFDAVWKPGEYVAAGSYYVVLKVNDLQVNYKKVVLTK